MYGNKKIDEIQLTNAIDLIWSTFLQFEAPNYSEEGIQSFKDFIDNKEILKTCLLYTSPSPRDSTS